MSLRVPLFCVAIGLLVAFAPGCGKKGPKRADLKGKVTYQSKPLAGATVTFQVEGSPIAVGTTDENGEFSIKDCPVGTAKVGVTKQSGSSGYGEMPKNPTPEDRMKFAKKPGSRPTPPKSEIPTKYSNPETSGLTAEVTGNEAENNFTFDLK